MPKNISWVKIGIILFYSKKISKNNICFLLIKRRKLKGILNNTINKFYLNPEKRIFAKY